VSQRFLTTNKTGEAIKQNDKKDISTNQKWIRRPSHQQQLTDRWIGCRAQEFGDEECMTLVFHRMNMTRQELGQQQPEQCSVLISRMRKRF
jgi:hypothetical protein